MTPSIFYTFSNILVILDLNRSFNSSIAILLNINTLSLQLYHFTHF